MRAVLLAVTVCALGAALAGCGGSGDKAASTPLWVKQASAICKRDDPKIKAAEMESPPLYSTFNMVQHWLAEIHALGGIGLEAHVPGLQSDSERAFRLLRYTSDPPPMDRALLRMKRDAAAKGVHCSFGVLPVNQLQVIH